VYLQNEVKRMEPNRYVVHYVLAISQSTA